LRGRWGAAIGITILFEVISTAIQLIPYVNSIIQIFLLPPFALGIITFFIALARNQHASINMLGEGFNRYWLSVGASFFVGIITATGFMVTATPAIALGIYAAMKESMEMIPWVVALAIPSIFVFVYLSLMFALPFYIIADDRSVGVFNALNRSRLIMQGIKLKLFCLQCRFIGWSLLAILTVFIGFIWVTPYFYTSMALFYDDVRGRMQDHPQ
jgi:uncharacterized membrane protein